MKICLKDMFYKNIFITRIIFIYLYAMLYFDIFSLFRTPKNTKALLLQRSTCIHTIHFMRIFVRSFLFLIDTLFFSLVYHSPVFITSTVQGFRLSLNLSLLFFVSFMHLWKSAKFFLLFRKSSYSFNLFSNVPSVSRQKQGILVLLQMLGLANDIHDNTCCSLINLNQLE